MAICNVKILRMMTATHYYRLLIKAYWFFLASPLALGSAPGDRFAVEFVNELSEHLNTNIPLCSSIESDKGIKYADHTALGQGRYASVFRLSHSDRDMDKHFVVKRQNLSQKSKGTFEGLIEQANYFQHELKINAALPTGLAPAIVDSYFCHDETAIYGNMMMPEAGVSLDKLTSQEFSADDVDKVLALIKRLHQAGIVHQDLGDKNILYDKNADSGHEFLFIDFGEAQFVDAMPEANLPQAVRNSRLMRIETRHLPSWLKCPAIPGR